MTSSTFPSFNLVPVIELFMEHNPASNGKAALPHAETERKQKLREQLKRELIACMESSLNDLLQII